MRLYIFNTIQPDRLYAVVAGSLEEATDLVDNTARLTRKNPGQPEEQYSIAEIAQIGDVGVGVVYCQELRQAHVMGG